MKPDQRVPETVASGLVVGLPGATMRAFSSTRRRMTRAINQNAAPDPGKGMGMESKVFVREASPPRAPAGAAAGLAGRPAAVSSAFWMTILFLGQNTNQTFAHMMLPMMPLRRMIHV